MSKYKEQYSMCAQVSEGNILQGEPRKSKLLFGVLGGTQVCAKQLNRRIFGFPMKNLTISGQYFQRFQ